MAGKGTTVIDFGPYPGVTDASFAITGQAGIVSGSLTDAWIQPADTTAGWGADGVFFGGFTNLARGGNLNGAVDSKLGILSCWAKMDDLATNSGYLLSGFDSSANEILYFIQTSQVLRLLAFNVGSARVDLRRDSLPDPNLFTHILASWDIGANVGTLYINDLLADNKIDRAADAVVPYSGANNWFVGSYLNGSSQARSSLAEFYFAPGQYLDFSAASNRRKFDQIVSGQILPVSLGTDGSTPTGTAPLIYLHLDNDENVFNFQLNRGTGGDLSWNSTATDLLRSRLIVQPGHSIDEHVVSGPILRTGNIVAATGFTIYGFAPQAELGQDMPLIYGKWNVGWAWS